MKRSGPAALLALALIGIPAISWSKGTITKITLNPLSGGSVIEMTDPKALAQFTVWSGPGVGNWDMVRTVPESDDPAFIIEWRKGIVEDEPPEHRRYLISMHVGGYRAPCNKYQVLYEVGKSGAGYVYLPRWDEPFGRCNPSLIYRDVEGNWFRSSKTWEEFVRPLLADDF